MGAAQEAPWSKTCGLPEMRAAGDERLHLPRCVDVPRRVCWEWVQRAEEDFPGARITVLGNPEVGTP